MVDDDDGILPQWNTSSPATTIAIRATLAKVSGVPANEANPS